MYWFRIVVMGDEVCRYKLCILELKEHQRKLTWHYLELQAAYMSLQSAFAHKPHPKIASGLRRLEDVLKLIDGHNIGIRMAIAINESAIVLLNSCAEAFDNLTGSDAIAQAIDEYYTASAKKVEEHQTLQ
jgi:hypothetical protein